MPTSDVWSVYIIECSDGTLYTGIAIDVPARIEKHNAGKGAKYTRGRRPVKLIGQRYAGDRGKAQKFEAFIKKQPKDQKFHALLHWCFYHGPFSGQKCEQEHEHGRGTT